MNEYYEYCELCNKQTVITVKCKCSKIFCLKHNNPDVHKCEFNHKLSFKQYLEKKLVKVEPVKIDKI